MAKKNKSLNSIGKKIFKIYWFGFFIVMILIVFFNIIDNNFDSSSEKLADGFTISSYNVILDVKSDNLIDVTENITVNWYENFHHGIYKFTPQWAQYTGKDGKTIKRKAIITNYQAIGEKYTLDTVKKKARIKIGDKNKYEIAKNLHISRSYVSRIEKRALTKILREFLKHNKEF